ncbi:hypothetical protein OSTOST_09533 [Ostertagia ostertagi]
MNTLSSLIVFVEKRSSSASCKSGAEGDTPLVRNTPEIGSFYVWCKKCDDIQRAKLRVYCNECTSSAVLVKKEPSCWRDVLKSRQIEVNCADCHATSYAAFCFKCIKCNEVGAVLSHIRGNWEHAECSVCLDEHTTYLFDFGCRHMVCRQCLYECLAFALKEGRFVFRPPFGYTITCPYPGCERVFCPYPDCNSSFFWETEDDDGKTSCPDCLRLFCRLCKSAQCVCGIEDPTTITIQATTK